MSNAHEGQSQHYQFMKRATAISRTPFRDGHVENVLEWLLPRRSIPGICSTLPCTPAGRPLCPIPRGRICTTLLFWNTISPNFLNVSRPHVRQFINTAEERKELDDALRVLFTLMQRAA